MRNIIKKIEYQWRKSTSSKIIIIFIGLFIIGTISNLFPDNTNTIKSVEEKESIRIENVVPKETEKIEICDGVNVIENCELDGVQYITYKYYSAQDETYHYETKTTYEKQIVGYCTSCNDGTRSPSCSTGSGTCSHHGGVAEWNAPIYEEVAKEEQVKIVDSPYVDEWYEKVLKE